MARTQSKFYPNDTLYRAVVDFWTATGDRIAYTDNFGPYATAATAKGVANQKTAWFRAAGRRVDIRIQKAETVWTDIE